MSVPETETEHNTPSGSEWRTFIMFDVLHLYGGLPWQWVFEAAQRMMRDEPARQAAWEAAAARDDASRALARFALAIGHELAGDAEASAEALSQALAYLSKPSLVLADPDRASRVLERLRPYAVPFEAETMEDLTGRPGGFPGSAADAQVQK